MEKLPRYGLVPFRVRRESDGFIFNRIWAAIKRECLMVIEEGVAAPEDVDGMWTIFTAPGIPPFRLMDRVGLDVVLNIEEHYAAVRAGLPEGPRKLLHELDRRRQAGRQERPRLLRLPRLSLRRFSESPGVDAARRECDPGAVDIVRVIGNMANHSWDMAGWRDRGAAEAMAPRGVAKRRL